MKTIVQTFGEYTHSLKLENCPPEVVEKSKTCVLDLIGVSIAGKARENAAVARATVKKIGAPGKATVWFSNDRLRALDAVLPNSVASHCILQDDWLQVSHSHIGAAIIPAAIAVAEEEGRSGKDVLEALIAGYDVEDRAGFLSVPAFTRGFRASGVYSHFGCASVAAKLMGLDATKTTNAIACVGSTASGLLQPWNEGSMEWSYQEGFGGRSGILAAHLAREGFVGAMNVFEGSHGVNRSFSGTNENERGALDQLGRHFHIIDTCFKRFPTGGANQGSASVAHHLTRRHKLDWKKIVRVDVDIPKAGSHERMNYAGIDYQGPFPTIDKCLISKQFAIAINFKTGDMNMADVERERETPEFLELSRKIFLHDATDINGWNLRMNIQMADGSTIKGDGKDIDQGQLYLSWADAKDKFVAVTKGIITDDKAKAIIDAVGGMEKMKSVAELTALLG